MTAMRSATEALLNCSSSDVAQVITEAQPPYRIALVNKAWCQLCGWSAAEAVGLTCSILQGPETSREALNELHTALKRQQKHTVRVINYKKNKEMFLNALTVEPVVDAAGNVTHFWGGLRPCATSTPTAGGAEITSKGVSGTDGADMMLLTREAFPLHTLNNHPIAPVLLRLVQLNRATSNSCAGRTASHPLRLCEGPASQESSAALPQGGPSTFVGRSGTCSNSGHSSSWSEMAGSNPIGSHQQSLSSPLHQHQNQHQHQQRPLQKLPPQQQQQQQPQQHYQHQQQQLSMTAKLLESGPLSLGMERGRKNEAFLAAVAGQGVLPPGSWPMPPRPMLRPGTASSSLSSQQYPFGLPADASPRSAAPMSAAHQGGAHYQCGDICVADSSSTNPHDGTNIQPRKRARDAVDESCSLSQQPARPSPASDVGDCDASSWRYNFSLSDFSQFEELQCSGLEGAVQSDRMPRSPTDESCGASKDMFELDEVLDNWEFSSG